MSSDRIGATDLLMFSHGWNNTADGRDPLYEAFFTRVKTLMELHGRAGRTVAYLGVYWPSIRWSDEPIPDFQAGDVVDLGAGTGGAAGGVGPPQVFDPPPPPDTQLAAMIREAFPSDLRGDIDDLLGLITDRPEDKVELRRARDLVARIATAAGPDGDGEQADRPPFAADADPQTQLFADFTAALEELNVETTGAGGAAGIGDAFGRLWHGAQEVLRGLTYWQMKNRAGVVGEKGLGPLIGRLRTRHADLSIDLIGHSFGARVVSYALKGAPQGDPSVRSVTLLQGAFSHFSYASSLPFDADRSGALNGQQDKASGAVTACYSRFDWAVGVMYPLASLLKGEDAAGANEPLYRWGSIGHDGHQKAVPELSLQQPGEHYDFTGKKLVNIDAQQVVRQGDRLRARTPTSFTTSSPGWSLTPEGWSTDRSSGGPADLGVARTSRHHRRAHPLHAQAGDGQGMAVLRRQGPLIGRDWPIAYRTDEAQRVEHPAPIRRAVVHVVGVSTQAADGGVAQPVGGAVRVDNAGLPAHRDVLPGARCRRLRRRRRSRAGPSLQGAHPGRRLRPERSAARRGLGRPRGRGRPVVIHCGSGPAPGTHTGPRPIRALLRRHPRLPW